MIAPVSLAPHSEPVTVRQSRTTWEMQVGRHRWALTRTRETRAIGYVRSRSEMPRSTRRKAFWPLAVGSFTTVSAFGLTVVGALATPQLVGKPHFALSIPVPDAPSRIGSGEPATRYVPGKQSLSHSSGAQRLRPVDANPGDGNDRHIAVAMQTGEFQDWRGADGRLNFLTAGPVYEKAGKRCRDLALLVRGSDGSNRVDSVHRCIGSGTDGGSVIVHLPAVDPASSVSDRHQLPQAQAFADDADPDRLPT